MGFYDVVKPCVVRKLHYARPTTQPIEVDDDVAEPLVAEGCLQPYEPQRISAERRAELIGSFFGDEQTESAPVDGGEVVTLSDETPAEPPKPRRGRRTGA